MGKSHFKTATGYFLTSIGLAATLIPAGRVLAQGESLKTNLVAYWPLDVIQGTKTPDLKNGYDLELVKLVATDLVPGQKGNCFQFDNARQTLLKRTQTAGEQLPVTSNPPSRLRLIGHPSGGYYKINRRKVNYGSVVTSGLTSGGQAAGMRSIIHTTTS